jgi:hypothetical protein
MIWQFKEYRSELVKANKYVEVSNLDKIEWPLVISFCRDYIRRCQVIHGGKYIKWLASTNIGKYPEVEK